MTNKVIGIRSGNQIIPYSGATKRTKQMDFSAAGLITSNRASWVTDRAVAVAYADSLGNWRLKFNIKGTCTANASNTLTFSSTAAVVFAAYPQAIAVSQANSPTEYVSYSNTVASTGNLDFGFLNSTVGSFSTSGDVELASEPSWAAANMEGVVNAPVYIANANDTTPGLLSYYKEGTWVPDFYSPSGTHALTGKTSVGSYIRIGNMVTVTGTLYYTGGNAGTASGALSIADLPFTVKNNGNSYAIATVQGGGWPTTSSPRLGRTTIGAARIELFTLASADARNNSSTPVDASTLAAYAEIYITCTYFV